MRWIPAAVLIFAASAALSACSYDGDYRYPCQDPDAWELEDCRPPKCSVWGTCPDYLLPSCGKMIGVDCSGV